MSIIDE